MIGNAEHIKILLLGQTSHFASRCRKSSFHIVHIKYTIIHEKCVPH